MNNENNGVVPNQVPQDNVVNTPIPDPQPAIQPTVQPVVEPKPATQSVVEPTPVVTPVEEPKVEVQPVNITEPVTPVSPVSEPVQEQVLASEPVTITELTQPTLEKNVEPEITSDEKPRKKKKSPVPFLVLLIIILILGLVATHLYYNGYFDEVLGKTTSSDNTSEKAKTDESTNNESEKKSETTTDKTSTTVASKLSEDEALKIGNELWEYVGNVYFGAPKVCAEGSSEILKKFTDDFEWTWGDDKDLGKLDETFINQECNSPFGRGSNVYYIDTVLSIDTINENELKFVATSQYCDDKWAAGQDKEACIKIKKEKDFILKKVDGVWKIAKYYLPN